jgi:hypothetical protein
VRNIGQIISDLEQQRAAIDRAISALREVSEPARSTAGTSARAATKKTPTKRHLSPEGRRRIIEATKRRWAAKRAADAAAAAQGQTAAKKAGAKRRGRRPGKKTAPGAAAA